MQKEPKIEIYEQKKVPYKIIKWIIHEIMVIFGLVVMIMILKQVWSMFL